MSPWACVNVSYFPVWLNITFLERGQNIHTHTTHTHTTHAHPHTHRLSANFCDTAGGFCDLFVNLQPPECSKASEGENSVMPSTCCPYYKSAMAKFCDSIDEVKMAEYIKESGACEDTAGCYSSGSVNRAGILISKLYVIPSLENVAETMVLPLVATSTLTR